MSSTWNVLDHLLRILLLAVGLLPVRTVAQIGPPGMGVVKSASWFAMGITQQLDTAGDIRWNAYVGHGRCSTSQQGMPWQRQAIQVFDQLITYRFHSQWQVGAGASLRFQQRYSDSDPFDRITPPRDEVRLHARIMHGWPIGRWRMQLTLKQELRRFFTPDLQPWKEDIEWRTRFKVQAEHALGQQGGRKVVCSLEELFAMDHVRGAQDAWTSMGYRETRASVYVVQRMANDRMEVALGGMADLVRGADQAICPYLAMSLTWRDPFGRPGAMGQTCSPR